MYRYDLTPTAFARRAAGPRPAARAAPASLARPAGRVGLGERGFLGGSPPDRWRRAADHRTAGRARGHGRADRDELDVVHAAAGRPGSRDRPGAGEGQGHPVAPAVGEGHRAWGADPRRPDPHRDRMDQSRRPHRCRRFAVDGEPTAGLRLRCPAVVDDDRIGVCGVPRTAPRDSAPPQHPLLRRRAPGDPPHAPPRPGFPAQQGTAHLLGLPVGLRRRLPALVPDPESAPPFLAASVEAGEHRSPDPRSPSHGVQRQAPRQAGDPGRSVLHLAPAHPSAVDPDPPVLPVRGTDEGSVAHHRQGHR